MKIRFWDRLLNALAGLLLIAVGAGLLFQPYFLRYYLDESPDVLLERAFFIGGIVAVVFGLYLLSYLFRGIKKKNSLVIQKTDYGELTISVKAIEGMVLKCTQEYDEVELLQSEIKNGREGIVVQLKIALAQDVNIPLAVNALQKHIKQYVTSSSGIDVAQVQVEVVSTDAKRAKGKFTIETPVVQPLMKESLLTEQKQEEELLEDEKELKEDRQETENSQDESPHAPERSSWRDNNSKVEEE